MKQATARQPICQLAERDAELRSLNAAVDSAVAGTGELILVEGTSGMGKTALLDYARDCARATGIAVLDSGASEFETNYAFGTALTLFLSHLSTLDRTEQNDLLSGRAATCRPLFDHAHRTISSSAEPDPFLFIDGLYWLTVSIATKSPVMILIDDIHCADHESLQFLTYLIRRLHTLPVAMVLTMRSDNIDSTNPLIASMATAAAERYLRLRTLTQSGVRDYLRTHAPSLLSIDGFVAACTTVTGGNPFLMRELVNAVRVDDTTDGATLVDDLTSIVPPALRRRVMLQLSHLGSDEVALARACAVLGPQATLGLAAPLAAISVEAAAHAADRLIRSGILGEGHRLSFQQPLTQSAIYRDIPPGQRALAHATAARLLRSTGDCPDVVVHHLLMGAPVAESWAADALQSVADAAARNGSPGTAAKYLRRAIVAELPERKLSSMLCDLGLLEAASGETETAVARLESAAQLVSEPAERAKCLYALGRTLYRDGRHTEAASAFERCAALCEQTDAELALAAAGAWIFTAYYLDAVPPAALTRLEELSAQVRRHGAITAADRTVLAVAALRSAMTTPPAAHGAKMAAEALNDGVLLGDQASDCVAATWAILALIYGGRLDEAAVAVGNVLADANARGNVPAAAEASLMRAFVHLARGEVSNAYVAAQSAVKGVEKGWNGLAPIAVGTLAQCHIERDELDEAEAVLHQAEASTDRPQARGLKSWIDMSRGRLRYRRGEMQGALDDFLSAGQALSVFGTTNPAVMRWRSMAGLAAHALGDTRLASDLIDQELHLAHAFDRSPDIGAALRAKATLASGARRESLLRESLAMLENTSSALDLAATLCCLGVEIRRAGQRTRSREPLSRAMDIAHRNGAVALARRAREELLASGAKPRRPTMTGVGSLTPTERRVAGLAAEGLTNPEIAVELYLAKSTVAWHLRHIYLKLNIESRNDLVHVFTQDLATDNGPLELRTVG